MSIKATHLAGELRRNINVLIISLSTLTLINIAAIILKHTEVYVDDNGGYF